MVPRKPGALRQQNRPLVTWTAPPPSCRAAHNDTNSRHAGRNDLRVQNLRCRSQLYHSRYSRLGDVGPSCCTCRHSEGRRSASDL